VAPTRSSGPPVAIAAAGVGSCVGYWIADSRGAVFNFGSASLYGSMAGAALSKPIVSMAPAPDGGGYWLVASDGGVFAFGDAPFFGSMGSVVLNKPVVSMAAVDDPDVQGYWLAASDGGVFAFGDARFFGSMGNGALNKPVVGIVATPDGGGYWLVASDGGVFAFGDARFFGSMGNVALNKPVVSMVAIADMDGGGYSLIASDGGVFSFGDARFLGSMANDSLHRPVVAASTVNFGSGYLLLGADGGVFAFGDAPFLGTVSAPPLSGTVIAIDPGHDGGNGTAPGIIDQPIWNGREDEPCDTVGSQTAGGYPEHLFNWQVAQDVAADLEAQGASVVLTRQSDTGVGPCVPERAMIGNDAHAAAAVSIHADGGPVNGRGFAVLEPVAGGINDAIVGSSAALGTDLRDTFLAATGEPVSNYDGTDGIQPRSDLGGLNLSTVPKVVIECANMTNPSDAALLVQPSWQQRAAAAITQGLSQFVASR
jgi:N-acetylmuramoyl-L-alanine amidase